MIRFTELRDVDLEAPKLLRVKPGPALKVKLLNTKYVGLDTHYWGGHTVACPLSDVCKACSQGLISVWAGFIFCQRWEGGRVAVLALTPVVAANLTMHANPVTGLLGMKISLSRKSSEPNSGIFCGFHGTTLEYDKQTKERLIMRVRIIFKDYVIQDAGESDESISQRAN